MLCSKPGRETETPPQNKHKQDASVSSEGVPPFDKCFILLPPLHSPGCRPTWVMTQDIIFLLCITKPIVGISQIPTYETKYYFLFETRLLFSLRKSAKQRTYSTTTLPSGRLTCTLSMLRVKFSNFSTQF